MKIRYKKERKSETGENEKFYKRQVDLPQLIPLWPKEIEDTSIEGGILIVKKLQTALRAERKRARAGHWAYNLTKHKALVLALKAEKEHLAFKVNEECKANLSTFFPQK